MASPKTLALSGLFGGILCCGLAIGIIPANRYLHLRQGLGAAGLWMLFGGYTAAQRDIKEQIAIDKQIAEYEAQQKLIREATQMAMLEEAKNNAVVSSEFRQQLHTLDASAGFAQLAHENHPAWSQQQIEAWTQQQIEAEAETETEAETKTKEKINNLAAKKAKLNLLISEHEGGWIGQLMKKPVLIYGDQGSGKSYFAEFLALCRYYLRGHQIVSIADPHFHQNKDECWKQLVKLKVPGFGAHHDYAAVNSQIMFMFDRFSKRTLKDSPITSIFDEVTRYGQEEATQESSSKLGSKLSSDPRKAKESPILIAHAKTLAALGGGEGFADAIQGNFVRLKLNSDSEQEPLWRGTISGIKDADGEPIENLKISIAPEWIRSSWVYDLFDQPLPEIPAFPEIPVEPIKHQQSPVAVIESDADKLDRILDQPISDDYWLSEMSPELLDRAIEMRNNQKIQVSESPTSISEVASLDTIHTNVAHDLLSQRLVAENFPGITEKALFDSIYEYSATCRNASKIIKDCLKCSHSKKGSPRSYKEVGKPVFIYLVRKYGEASLIAKFADYLDK
jgi:hypothetical protein